MDAVNHGQKDEIKTVNNFLMEYAIEYVEAIKLSEEELRKNNKVRKHKRVAFPYELVGSSSVTLTSCGGRHQRG